MFRLTTESARKLSYLYHQAYCNPKPSIEGCAMESQQYVLSFVALCCCQQYETNIVFHIKCQIFLSNCNNIWSFMTFFVKCPQYQVSQKSIQQEPQ